MIKDYTSILQYLETLTATNDDYILINTGGNNKKIKLSNFISSLGLSGGNGGTLIDGGSFLNPNNSVLIDAGLFNNPNNFVLIDGGSFI